MRGGGSDERTWNDRVSRRDGAKARSCRLAAGGVRRLQLICCLAASLAVGLTARRVPPAGLVLALLPLLLVLLGRERFWNRFMLVFLGALAVGGHDFSYLHVGPIYGSEVALGAYLLGCTHAVARGMRWHYGATALVGGLCAVTVLSVYASGVTGEVLRNSVLGLYSLWLLVGLAIGSGAHRYVEQLPRLLYWASLPASFPPH